MTTAAPTSIPFSRLVATDAINARASTKDGLDELAASIAVKGVIQPLAVRPQDGSNRYEIIDGRRRFQALAKLVKAGTLAKTYAVPIHVRNETDGEALETSLMANTVRLPMHPVEQHEVFARLADAGTSVDDIAARFGLAERTVRQQLALGKLAPQIRDAWRKGKLDADAAKAYAASGADHAAQVRHYDAAKKQGHYALSQHAIRADLTRQRTPARDIPQRTLDLYVQRGGTLTEDLFDDARYVDDALLLAAVRKEITAGLADELRAEGWGWVAHESDLPRDHYHWDELDPPEYTDADMAELDAVDKAAHDAKVAEIMLRHWTAEQKAGAGAIIRTRYDGAVIVERGLIRPAGEREAAEAAADLDDSAGDMEVCPDCGGVEPDDCDTCGGEGEVPVEAEALPPVSALTGSSEDDGEADPYAISGALMETITTAQTNAAAYAVRHDRELAVRLAVASLSVPTYATPVKISIANFEASGIGQNAQRDFDEELARMAALPIDDVLDVLARFVAQAVNLRAHHHDDKRTDDAVLVSVLDPVTYVAGISREFLPADYFKRATKATALAAIDELIEAGCGAGLAPVDVLAGMKKADLAEVAASRATACGWLPPQLRHPAYALTPATEAA